MKSKRKIWLGIGAFVIVGAGPAGAAGAGSSPSDLRRPAGLAAGTTTAATSVAGSLLAQHGALPSDESGEEGGEKGAAVLPPEIAFAMRIALLRGHLLVGDELVAQVDAASVIGYCPCPCATIALEVPPELPPARGPVWPIPNEAEVVGGPGSILVFAENGYLSALEVAGQVSPIPPLEHLRFFRG